MFSIDRSGPGQAGKWSLALLLLTATPTLGQVRPMSSRIPPYPDLLYWANAMPDPTGKLRREVIEVETDAGLKQSIGSGKNIVLKRGRYTLPGAAFDDLRLIGASPDVVVIAKGGVTLTGSTFLQNLVLVGKVTVRGADARLDHVTVVGDGGPCLETDGALIRVVDSVLTRASGAYIIGDGDIIVERSRLLDAKELAHGVLLTDGHLRLTDSELRGTPKGELVEVKAAPRVPGRMQKRPVRPNFLGVVRLKKVWLNDLFVRSASKGAPISIDR